MALLTKAGMNKILSHIMASGGMTEDMEEDFDRIIADFDEREGILKEYGETYDGEDKDEYDWSRREETDRPEQDRKWKEEYDSLKERYVKRFFGGDRGLFDEVEEEIVEETEEDVKRDGTVQTFDELLKKVEG